jgi:hypothetical protein
MTDEIRRMKRFQSDWTRLLPRKDGSTNQERVSYLVDFIEHRRGSRVAVNKAVKELTKLSQSK